MHYSVGQESVNLEMETKARSLQVAIYFKLESSKSAADEVLKLLTTVCKNSGVEVIPYKDYQKGSNNLLLSVVVVIDARQTNIADEQKPITPYEDHVEELAKLEKETSPNGSLLMVIYGDSKHSLNLNKERHVAKHWLESWRSEVDSLRDTRACDLAEEGRCFSIDKDFNEKQEEMLRQYFHWASIAPDVTANRARSQHVAIYTKLESFKKSADDVRGLLKTALRYSDIQVSLSKDYQKGSNNLPLSVVVVIDARQTRTLITPERGDRNVDHVEELAKLDKEISPKGSILIVIYGDEHSKDLGDSEHLAKHWLQSWKFNDSLAHDLAAPGRCFSIYEDFNKKQEEMLRQYIKWVPKIYDKRVDASTMVLGKKGKEQVSYLFSDNPFYKALPTDGLEDETQYGYFSFQINDEAPTFQIDFNTSLDEVKVCESTDFQIALASQLQNLNTTRYGTTPSKTKRPPYDNAIMSSHCSKCYNTLIRNKEEVKKVLKREAFDVENVVIPVVSDDQADRVKDEAWRYINEERVKIKQRRLKENEMDAKSLLQTSILTACQSVKKSRWKEVKKFMLKYRKWIMLFIAVILLFLIVLVVSIIVSREEGASTPMTTLAPNTTSFENTTMPSPLTNTTLPTNLTTAENATSISPTNGSVTTMPTPLTNLTTVENSTSILPTNDSDDTTNTTM